MFELISMTMKMRMKNSSLSSNNDNTVAINKVDIDLINRLNI